MCARLFQKFHIFVGRSVVSTLRQESKIINFDINHQTKISVISCLILTSYINKLYALAFRLLGLQLPHNLSCIIRCQRQ